ncbi:MAG TPA: RNA 2'-phosphotransferase [Kofleriaceae bacterium]|jgi:putative RNA 2'-phosphotransferase|nr:RNA 2'-phosphotransferase [Kofleriaceae bacterium]
MSEAISKRLSYVLRHRPDAIGITLDGAGWASVDDLLAALARHGTALSRAELAAIVGASDKRRFALSADGTRIRTQQGHSVPVELGHAEASPPATLYHGTVERFLASIGVHGLHRGTRHHVHLSAAAETAIQVGARRGRPVILEIDAAAMAADGHRFWLTPNQVWLTDEVPARYIRLPARLPAAPPRAPRAR